MRQRWILSVLACVLLSSPVTAAPRFDHRPDVESLKASLARADRVELAERTDRALGAMIKLAAWELDRKGYRDEADQLRTEYAEYDGYVARIARAQAFGEVPELYEPLSRKLSDWYHLIKALLGDELTHMLRLDDLQCLNWGTPTVLRLDVIGDASPDADLYSQFFVPWSGVIAYWSVWITCEVVTYGSGWFLICTPAAWLGERVTVKYVAPRFNDRVWAYFYAEGIK